MATAVTADTYLQQIHIARTQLHECFRRAHELLTEREAHLLRELETIQNAYEAETNSQQEELQGLEASKPALKNNLRNSDTLNKALAAINEQMDTILKLSSETPQTIRFQWNADLDRDLQQAGEIITNTPQPINLTPAIPPPANLSSNTPQYANLTSDIQHADIITQPANTPIPPRSDVTTHVIPKPAIHYQNKSMPVIPAYKNKSIPSISCCKKGTAPGELNCSRGLAVESQSGRIYIADQGNNRVQVFTSNGVYLFMFRRNMNSPHGICINNDTVYVSQYYGHCITSYKLNGTYVNKFGSKGTMNDQFNGPTGLVISPVTGLLYVCDMNNDRVQIFDNKFKFNSIFYNHVNGPKDIKLTNDLLIVLDAGDPCVHIFSITDHFLLNSVISCGAGKQMRNPQFFTIDAKLNLLLTDYDYYMNCVRIFSLRGEIIAEIGKKFKQFLHPTGIAIDEQNRIIVVSENDGNKYASLQIF